jgi:hypothetical protein
MCGAASSAYSYVFSIIPLPPFHFGIPRRVSRRFLWFSVEKQKTTTIKSCFPTVFLTVVVKWLICLQNDARAGQLRSGGQIHFEPQPKPLLGLYLAFVAVYKNIMN